MSNNLNQIANETNTTTKEIIMNDNTYILTKEQFKTAISDFKTIFNDKEKRKKIIRRENSNEVIYTLSGALAFEHFLFYHMMKESNYKKATHSTESANYKDTIKSLAVFANYKDDLENRYIYKRLQKGFPSLSAEDMQAIIKKALL